MIANGDNIDVWTGFLTALVALVDIILYLSTVSRICSILYFVADCHFNWSPSHITSVRLDLIIINLVCWRCFLALSFLMPKLYSNTVLSSLNARKKLQRDMGTDSGTTKSISRRVSTLLSLDRNHLTIYLHSACRCRETWWEKHKTRGMYSQLN